MKSVLADRTTIYINVHRWSKHDKESCLGAQAGDPNPLFLRDSLTPQPLD